jgi:ABC-type antimicrobial peptide transport system permease subunit
VDASLWPESTLAWLSMAFGVGAAALAALGVFATVSYAVAQSKREIAIRTALGSPPAEVIRVLSIRPLLFACLGVVAGLGCFMFLAPTLSPLLYGISPGNPLVTIVAPVTVLLVVLGALLVSSRTALRVNPASALREE